MRLAAEADPRIVKLQGKLDRREEALKAVIEACDADCGLDHIKWLAKQGLK